MSRASLIWTAGAIGTRTAGAIIIIGTRARARANIGACRVNADNISSRLMIYAQ